MHLLHQLLPNPLGDAPARIGAASFGPRAIPGIAPASLALPPGTNDVAAVLAARMFAARFPAAATSSAAGPAGGDLTGTYPNPTLVGVVPPGTYGAAGVDSKGRVVNGIAVCPVANGGTGVNAAASGGAGQVVKQLAAGGAFTVDILSPAEIPVFPAAGTFHSKGGVPDPGATAHPNQPRIVGDGAAWVKHSGKFLGKSIVLTDQSTASAIPTDLITPDSLTFTLDEASLVLLDWSAEYYVTGTAGNLSDSFVITGAGAPASSMGRQPSATALSLPLSTSMQDVVSFPAGTFTVKVQHSINAGTGHWRNRTLLASMYS